MIFNSDNMEDIKKYFRGSYMKFPSSYDEVFYVSQVSSNGLAGRCLDIGDGVTEWTYTFNNGIEEVDFVLPKKSYFVYNGYAHFLCRVPAKQYSRGICETNTAIWRLQLDEFIPVPVELSILNAYASKPSFQGFVMDGTKYSYAVSSRIAVCNTGKIYIDRIRIGHVDKMKSAVYINQEMFIPEIESIIKEYNTKDIGVFYSKVAKRPPKTKTISPAPIPAEFGAILTDDFLFEGNA